jgi:hypothetical protein
MNLKLSWPIAIVLAVLAPMALPVGAAEAVVDVVELLGNLHIAEFAAAANALTIIP